MEKVHVSASKEYDVIIGRDFLQGMGSEIAKAVKPCKAAIVTDTTVNGLYGKDLEKTLSGAGFMPYTFAFPPGEGSKTMGTVTNILEWLAENDFTRSSLIVALGGGIPGDVAGFAASVYLRGIPFIQIPTTFLAAVDSSVGGKTGVNLKFGKNLAGAFWQPSLALCDCNTFATLPYEVFLDGVAETIKYGAIFDKSLITFLVDSDLAISPVDDQDIVKIVQRCISIKRDIVMEDERDTGRRQLLNFGHTIGHAIEKCSNYTISHGHAVAIGMLAVSHAAYKNGLTDTDCTLWLADILKLFGFPLKCPFTAEELTESALKDKKRDEGTITLVIPDFIGKCRLEKLPINKLNGFIRSGLGYQD